MLIISQDPHYISLFVNQSLKFIVAPGKFQHSAEAVFHILLIQVYTKSSLTIFARLDSRYLQLPA